MNPHDTGVVTPDKATSNAARPATAAVDRAPAPSAGDDCHGNGTPAAPPCFRLETAGDGIATLVFDCPDSRANVLHRDNLLELEQHLAALAADTGTRGLILTSAKPSIFIAGADLRRLRDADAAEVDDLIGLGQRVFTLLQRLPFPTVAAIHGACAGGGFELALACRHRIASDHRSTKIGLPETGLGLIPGWGGSTRLPRLIGLAAAVPLVLKGSLLPAPVALRRGLVDQVVAPEHLADQARLLVTSAPRPRRTRLRARCLHLPGIRHLYHRLALRQLRQKTRGHYPAQEKALQVMVQGVGTSMRRSLELERSAFAGLLPLESTRHLTGLFFQREQAKRLTVADGKAAPVERVAVVGAGVMGAGIAYWLAARGLHVLLQDVADDPLAKALHGIRRQFDDAVRRRHLTATEAQRAFDRIAASSRPVPLHRFQAIIEAAPEDMEIKQRLYRELASRSAPGTLWCSNTSALPITQLAAAAPDPSRFVGLHFFNPVHRMPLIEIVPGGESSPDAVATAVGLVQTVGKLPVLARDKPGFLVNRVLMPYLMEAVRLFDQGHTATTIDHAMLDFGMPMGPLRLLDEVGLDVALHVGETLAPAFDHFPPAPLLLREMIDEGLLGRKNGRGFYLHQPASGWMAGLAALALPSRRGQPRPNPAAARLAGGRGDRLPVPADGIAGYLAGLLEEEAARCLREGIADNAGAIDFAMVAGTGYPPFRGGPLARAGLRDQPRTTNQ